MEKPHPVVGADPLEVVRHFIERCGTQTLMRRYRLPNFVGAEGFLEVTLVVLKKMPGKIVNSQVDDDSDAVEVLRKKSGSRVWS